MYDGLEQGLTDETCVCYACERVPSAQSWQYVIGACAAGHFLRVCIRNGNIDTGFRDEVLAELYRSTVRIVCGRNHIITTVGVGLVAAQAQGFCARDPRVGAASSWNAYNSDQIQALALSPWSSLAVCPKWLDSVDCVLDIPTLLCGPFALVHDAPSPTIVLLTCSTLDAHITSGRVRTSFGFDRNYGTVPSSVDFKSVIRQLATLQTCRSVSWSCAERKSFWYDLQAHHIPETLIIHFAGDGSGPIDTITVFSNDFDGDAGQVIVSLDVRVDVTGCAGTICVFDLRGLFAKPPTTIVLRGIYLTYLSSLLISHNVEAETEVTSGC